MVLRKNLLILTVISFFPAAATCTHITKIVLIIVIDLTTEMLEKGHAFTTLIKLGFLVISSSGSS